MPTNVVQLKTRRRGARVTERSTDPLEVSPKRVLATLADRFEAEQPPVSFFDFALENGGRDAMASYVDELRKRGNSSAIAALHEQPKMLGRGVGGLGVDYQAALDAANAANAANTAALVAQYSQYGGWAPPGAVQAAATGAPPPEPLAPDYTHPDAPGGHWVWQPIADQASFAAYAQSRGLVIGEVGNYYNTATGKYYAPGDPFGVVPDSQYAPGNPDNIGTPPGGPRAYLLDRYGHDVGAQLHDIEQAAKDRSSASAAVWTMAAIAATAGTAAAFFGGAAAAGAGAEAAAPAAEAAATTGEAAAAGGAAAAAGAAELAPITVAAAPLAGGTGAVIAGGTLLAMPDLGSAIAGGAIDAGTVADVAAKVVDTVNSPAVQAGIAAGQLTPPPSSVLGSDFKDWATSTGVQLVEKQIGAALSAQQQKMVEDQIAAYVAQQQQQWAAQGVPGASLPSASLDPAVQNHMLSGAASSSSWLPFAVLGLVALGAYALS